MLLFHESHALVEVIQSLESTQHATCPELPVLLRIVEACPVIYGYGRVSPSTSVRTPGFGIYSQFYF